MFYNTDRPASGPFYTLSLKKETLSFPVSLLSLISIFSWKVSLSLEFMSVCSFSLCGTYVYWFLCASMCVFLCVTASVYICFFFFFLLVFDWFVSDFWWFGLFSWLQIFFFLKKKIMLVWSRFLFFLFLKDIILINSFCVPFFLHFH
jgi:hypothetical protein